MEALSASDIFLFEEFRLDRRGLFRREEGAAAAPVEIGSRALAVLGVLLRRPGELLSRDEIMAAAWPRTVVEDNNLTIQISTLRRVLDQDCANFSCIQTVPGRGYRFVAPVTRRQAVATPATAAFSQSDARRLPRLSIVVLPFTNLSNGPEQQYLSDGITEDLTSDLSRLESMFVISRNTAFTYQGKRVDTKQIGRELGVRYVLEGSVRRSGSQVRVNAQLIDAETDAHLWAERFHGNAADLFALQDEITSRIANALNIELLSAEAARPTERPDVQEYILRFRAAWNNPPARDNYVQVISLLEHALALDPQSVDAQSWLATVLAARAMDGMSDSAAADIKRAEGLAGQALAASSRSPLAHYAKGQVLRAQTQVLRADRCEQAITEYETALASNRNWLSAYAHIALCKFFAGSIEDAIPLYERVLRLSLRDPNIGEYYMRIGNVHLLQSRIDEAIVWLEKARGAMPEHPIPHASLAAAYGLRGETEHAGAELAEARRLSPDDRYSSIARVRAIRYYGVPKVRSLYEATYFVGLRKAGMPEE
jgi:TolB-like protein/Tfp pilus assembly protein PilF